jgi:hypothetical protein
MLLVLHIGQASYYRMWWLVPTAVVAGICEVRLLIPFVTHVAYRVLRSSAGAHGQLTIQLSDSIR